MYRSLLSVLVLACTTEEPIKPAPEVPTDPGPSLPSETTPPETDTGETDTAEPPETEPAGCLTAQPEICANGVDDDGDGRIDCAIEGWEDAPYGTLVVDDAGWLYSPGDLDGDGLDDVIGFNAIDTPIVRTAASVLYGSFSPGESEPEPALTVLAQGYTGTQPLAERDIDGNGVVDLVLPMVIEEGWTCQSALPWEVYLLPLDLQGEVDAAASAISTLRAPSGWDLVSPAVYISAAGDPNRNGTQDVIVEAVDCATGYWYLVDGSAFTPGIHPVNEVAYAVLRQDQDIPTRAYDLGDVNGDGERDLGIVTYRMSDNVGRMYVFTEPMSGEIDLSSANTLITVNGGDMVFAFSSANGEHDLTGDGIPDLLLGTIGPAGGASILQGPLPPGTVDLEASRWSSYAAPGAGDLRADVADLNGDGALDIAIGVLQDGLHVDYAPCAGDHPLPPDGVPSYYANQFTLLDATGDGWTDLVLSIEGGTGGYMQIVAGGPAQ